MKKIILSSSLLFSSILYAQVEVKVYFRDLSQPISLADSSIIEMQSSNGYFLDYSLTIGFDINETNENLGFCVFPSFAAYEKILRMYHGVGASDTPLNTLMNANALFSHNLESYGQDCYTSGIAYNIAKQIDIDSSFIKFTIPPNLLTGLSVNTPILVQAAYNKNITASCWDLALANLGSTIDFNNDLIGQDAAANYSFVDITKVVITDLSSTSVQENWNDISIFPNPAINIIQIQTNNRPISTIQIIDAAGQLVVKNATISSNTVNIEDLSEGIYTLIIHTTNGSRVFKQFTKL